MQIRVAVDFAATHQDAIDAEIAANDEAAERLREVAASRAEMMAS